MINPGPLERFLQGGNKEPRGEPRQRWPRVYANVLAVHETLRWIGGGALRLQADCRAMVEDGTHPKYLRELANDLGGPWRDLWITLYGRDGALRTEARQVLLDWFRPAMDQPVLKEQVVRSRIGADKLSLATKFVSPFGRHVDRLHVPGDGWGQNRKRPLATAAARD